MGFSDGSDIPDHVHFANNSHFVADVCCRCHAIGMQLFCFHVEDKLVSKCCTFVYHNITLSARVDGGVSVLNPSYYVITPLLLYFLVVREGWNNPTATICGTFDLDNIAE